MLSKEAQNALVGWEFHGSYFKTKKNGITMNVIKCYAPTNDSNDGNHFYERLQSIIVKYSRKNLTILIGYLSAQVGMDNTGYEDIIGRHGLGERNKNVERLANIYTFNNLFVGDEMFSHKRIHKATWISPDHNTENQRDYNCINIDSE
ncbi:unnamed protein product [Schistosoma margrebowiei]|uniref:Uncharacterized protein n=1 Tax=Schistosoma margrebowiei TaxID=48269 RepID=A0A183NA09_9TREM|nr:unnamed protein product [Schistosoma margrebowiei]